MKILKEAFITKTSIDDIVEMSEKHPVAIERLKKIRDEKKDGYFEDLVKDIYPNGVALENLFDLLETDADMVEEEIGIKFESIDESIHKEPVVVGDTVKLTANNGWNIIYDGYGFGFTDGYRTDRLTVYDDGHWASDSPERLPAYIKREMNKLIDKYGVEFFDRRTTPLNKKLGFEESLNEGKYGFLKKYKDYRIIETPSSYVVTDKFGTTKGESRTLSGAEGLIDELADKNESIPPMNIPTKRKSNPMSVKDFARRNGIDVKKLQRDFEKEHGFENDPNFNADESLTEANLSDVERQLERAKSAGDDTQAWDLAMCIENDEDIYRRFVTPAINNLKRKLKKGSLDETLAIQLFYYVVENSLKNHPRWFPYSLKDVSVPTRYLAAEELYNFFEDEIKAGESLSESVIYKTRKEAEKEKERNDVIVKVDGGYQLMSPEEYRVWKMQK